VYFFKKGKDIIYIGKATSLRDRVRSYFNDDLIQTRGRLLVDMITQADSLDFEEADSVLEAFIKESELIKKYQPKFNTKDKDNKSFNYVVITKEDFPRILVVRGRNLESAAVDFTYTDSFGPYPFGSELKEALKLIRRIFPFRDRCTPFTGVEKGKINSNGSKIVGSVKGKPCFNRSIGLCPGVCTGEVTKEEYGEMVRHIRLFFKGKKQELIEQLETEMHQYSKRQEFEKAGEIKKTLFALMHIQDISLIKKDSEYGTLGKKKSNFRIEAYDIAHMSGKDMIGVMVVMEDGEFSKKEYKKFNIKTIKQSDDTGALKEMLERRFNHTEWSIPHLLVLDGGKAQLSVAEKLLSERGLKNIAVVSVLKDEKHKAKDILDSSIYSRVDLVKDPEAFFDDGDIISLNQECHRFAIATHRKKRALSFGA
jgi:excinuclease ABC subunit C